jgi:MFS family permease
VPRPLRGNRDFVLLQVGQALSTVGAESTAVAYPLLVLALTHSPLKAGIVGFCRLGPYALFVLFAGVASDRWNRKRLMLLAEVVRALAMTSIVVAIALDRITYEQIVAAAFVESTMFALFNISELGTLAAVVPRRQLPEAAAVEQARLSSVFLVGPPLGGFLFGLGRALPFLADAARSSSPAGISSSRRSSSR